LHYDFHRYMLKEYHGCKVVRDSLDRQDCVIILLIIMNVKYNLTAYKLPVFKQNNGSNISLCQKPNICQGQKYIMTFHISMLIRSHFFPGFETLSPIRN